MADYSKMSDAELMALVQPQQPVDYSKMSDEDLLKAVNGPSTAEDMAKSGGIGLAKGAIGIAGAGGDIRSLLNRGADYLGGKAGLSPETIETAKDVTSRV